MDGFQEALVPAIVGDGLELAGRGIRQTNPRQGKMAVTDHDAADFAEQFVAFPEMDDGLVGLGQDDMEVLDEQLGLLVVGEIANDDAGGGRFPAPGACGTGQMRPGKRSVCFLQAQFAVLRGAGLGQPAPKAGVDVLVFRKHEFGQRFADQSFDGQGEQGGQGPIGGQNSIAFVEEAIAGGSVFEEAELRSMGGREIPSL